MGSAVKAKLTVSLALISLLVLAACGGSDEKPAQDRPPTTAAATDDPSGHKITGVLVLTSDSVVRDGSGCKGNLGYNDIHGGAAVTALNESSTIIASTSLLSGSLSNRGCEFQFVLTGVPDASFYTFKIGHRDGPAYSRSDMESAGWDVTLTLGQ
jgi:hypothetical protein